MPLVSPSAATSMPASLLPESPYVDLTKARQSAHHRDIPTRTPGGPRSCIPILSEDYPSSERCLRGLVQMMEGKKSARQKVFPIFDRVKPSDVLYLRGSFGKSFHSRDAEDIKEELRALKDVSLLHGFRKVTDGPEEELVKIVVQTVLRCLQPNIPKGPRIAQYNVFLNFRGADTRKGFTHHLYTNLVDAGVSVFKDDIDLPIGEEFCSQLLSAIKRSTIYIMVLSRNYASSKWCLRELTKMMECRETNGHMVLPIFYDVEHAHPVVQAKKVFRDLYNMAGFHHGVRRVDDGELTGYAVQKTLRLLRHRFQLDVPERLLSTDDRVKSD